MVNKILSRAAVVVFGIVVALLALELGLRAFFSLRGTEEQKAMYLYDAQQVDAHTYEFAGAPFLNFTLNPNYPDVNPRGYRGALVTVPKPKGVFRILAIGGSTTYGGGGLTAKQAWPFQLQAQLKNQYGYDNVQVVNLGVPSYISLNSLIQLQTKGLALEPDMVIDYDNFNDALYRIYEEPECYSGDTPMFGMGTDQGTWQNTGRDLPVSTLYRVLAIKFGWMDDPINLKERVTRTGLCPPQSTDGSTFSKRRQENPPIYFERNMRSIAAIAQNNHARMMFASFAWDVATEKKMLAADPTLDGTRALLDAVDEQNTLIKQIAGDSGSLYEDLATEMANNVDNSPYWQDDHIHQTIIGSQRQAALMAAFIDKAGVIPK